MLIKVIIYCGCPTCVRRCKKSFMCMVPFIGPLSCQPSRRTSFQLNPGCKQPCTGAARSVLPRALAALLLWNFYGVWPWTQENTLGHSCMHNSEPLMLQGATLDQYGTDANE